MSQKLMINNLKPNQRSFMRRIDYRILMAMISLAITPAANATIVVPSSASAFEGNNNSVVPFNSGARTNQYQMTSAALGGLPVGSIITGVQFRLDGGASTAPGSTASWTDYEISLAEAANAINSMSSTLASNMVNPVLVKDGAFTLPANSLPGTGTPRDFGGTIMFDSSYTYLGGDLVLLLTHSSGSAGPTVDGITTDTAGTGGIRALATPVGFRMPTADNTAFRFPVMQFVVAVPEPASLGLLVLGGLLAVSHRGRKS